MIQALQVHTCADTVFGVDARVKGKVKGVFDPQIRKGRGKHLRFHLHKNAAERVIHVKGFVTFRITITASTAGVQFAVGIAAGMRRIHRRGKMRHTVGVGATAHALIGFRRCGSGYQIGKVHGKRRLGQTQRGKIHVQAVVVEIHFQHIQAGHLFIGVHRSAFQNDMGIKVFEHGLDHIGGGHRFVFKQTEQFIVHVLQGEDHGSVERIGAATLFRNDFKRFIAAVLIC